MNQVATRDYAVESTFFSRADGAGVVIFCCHDNHAPGREDDSGKPQNYYFSIPDFYCFSQSKNPKQGLNDLAP